MKESHIEGVATHDDPESCATAREGWGEALRGTHGLGIEPRKQAIRAAWRKATRPQGAMVFRAEGPNSSLLRGEEPEFRRWNSASMRSATGFTLTLGEKSRERAAHGCNARRRVGIAFALSRHDHSPSHVRTSEQTGGALRTSRAYRLHSLNSVPRWVSSSTHFTGAASQHPFEPTHFRWHWGLGRVYLLARLCAGAVCLRFRFVDDRKTSDENRHSQVL